MRTALLLLALCAMFTHAAHAQKPELITEKATIEQRTAEELDRCMLPGAALREAALREGLIGRYMLSVTVQAKGRKARVKSVGVVSAADHDIRSQNRFKDLVHSLELPLYLPKDQLYRIEHFFDLNNNNP